MPLDPEAEGRLLQGIWRGCVMVAPFWTAVVLLVR